MPIFLVPILSNQYYYYYYNDDDLLLSEKWEMNADGYLSEENCILTRARKMKWRYEWKKYRGNFYECSKTMNNEDIQNR